MSERFIVLLTHISMVGLLIYFAVFTYGALVDSSSSVGRRLISKCVDVLYFCLLCLFALDYFQIISIRLFPVQMVNGVALILFGLSFLIFKSAKNNLPKGSNTCICSDVPKMVSTQGIYRWIRHPIYTSYLLFLAGVCVALPSMSVGVISILLLSFYIYSSRYEQVQILNSNLGDEYRRYMQKTHGFWPKTITGYIPEFVPAPSSPTAYSFYVGPWMDEIRDIRKEAYEEIQSTYTDQFLKEVLHDEKDDRALHIIIRKGSSGVAACRMMFDNFEVQSFYTLPEDHLNGNSVEVGRWVKRKNVEPHASFEMLRVAFSLVKGRGAKYLYSDAYAPAIRRMFLRMGYRIVATAMDRGKETAIMVMDIDQNISTGEKKFHAFIDYVTRANKLGSPSHGV